MKNKKIFKKATIGTSLLMSAVLLCGNTVKAHAQADLTPEESQKLTEFLATQPTNGDTVHVYKKVVTPTTTPEPETPVNPTNPGDSGNVNGGNDEDTTPANPTEGETPVNPTPTPNPTPEPDVPVVEDNHGNNTGGNTETPAVPNPIPEPSVPTDETPSQPVNPTDETPVVPNNPTDNTVVPPTVEEKPVVEEKPIETKDVKPSRKENIPTGVESYFLTYVGLALVSGAGVYKLAKE